MSSFEYGLNDFITALVTPYGRTTFAMGVFEVNGRNRWLEATDPLGARERIEYWNQTFFVPGSEDDYEVPWQPNGILDVGEPPSEASFRGNDNLEFRNTFYWSKLAMDRHPGDFQKAEILYWLKDIDPNQTSATLESRKMPLENRVWYGYAGQTNFNHRGTEHQPILVGRVVDVDEANPTRQARTQLFQYEYDSKGNVTKSIDPVGRETVLEYDINEIDLLRVKQWNGTAYKLLQESGSYVNNQPGTVTDAAGQTTIYTYNASGQLETITTPERAGITETRTTTYEYDLDGYLESVSDPAKGATTEYAYDGFGRLRTLTDSDDYTRVHEYDELNRITQITYPDSTFEETVYENLDPILRRDRLGRWMQTFYDALRRVNSVRDLLGRTVTQQWCRCGSMDALIDANGNATTWERDVLGRVTKEIRANGSEWLYVYETTTTRLKTVTDPKGQAKTYSYFLDDNLKGMSYTNEEHDTPNVSFTYETVFNRVATMLDGTGTTTYGYHPIGTPPPLGAGRVASVDGPLSNDTITYGYDELGRVLSRAINGVALTDEYDALGRMIAENNVLGSFSYQYDGVTSRLRTVTSPNGKRPA